MISQVLKNLHTLCERNMHAYHKKYIYANQKLLKETNIWEPDSRATEIRETVLWILLVNTVVLIFNECPDTLKLA